MGTSLQPPSRASLGGAVIYKICVRHKSCGSGLARDSGVSGSGMLDVPPSSRASPLPQYCGVFESYAVRHGWVSCQAVFGGKPRSYSRRALSHNTSGIRPLALTSQRSNINHKEKLSRSPQVEAPNNRHSTNRANTQNNSISAKLPAKSPGLECPFD
ncbi:hypothetical protein F7R14_01705 [Pseudomonas lini]|uniref:Uncharacterized protein n=1 Tax=Pseudomonas lini TaxID=163011 RepID=A0A7V7P8J3_9PSED|nr:hypothetical protein F7R14_01705 [Pseudomonas lini]